MQRCGAGFAAELQQCKSFSTQIHLWDQHQADLICGSGRFHANNRRLIAWAICSLGALLEIGRQLPLPFAPAWQALILMVPVWWTAREGSCRFRGAPFGRRRVRLIPHAVMVPHQASWLDAW